MRTQTVDISSLTCDPSNVRKHGERNVETIMASLTKFGQQKPIVVDKDGVVVAGNGTLEAARALGWDKLAVVRTGLKGADAAAYAIADNRTAELAEWDDRGLATILESLKADDEIDELITGFTAKEIDDLISGNNGEVVEDEIPEPPSEPVTKPGDLWTLGEHRVLCGDSTKIEDIGRIMGGKSADAVLTDPPYGIGFEYDTYDDSRDSWFSLMDDVVPKLRSSAPIVLMPCCRIDRIGWWYANHRPDWMICWYKGSPGHRSYVGFNDWEALLVWGKPPKQMHDYFQTACGFDSNGHPCPKPVAWGAWLCERICAHSGIVLDPFLGSGTTLIAAEQLGRKCYGLEIEPKYCDIIVQRWENLTGGKAVRNG